MPRCKNCNKFMMFGTKSAFCKDCEAIIMESKEKEKREEQKKEELKSGTINDFVFETLPDGTLRIVEFDGVIPSFLSLKVPAQLDGRRVSTIGTDLMTNNSRVKCAIEVSEGITVIEDGAFGNPNILEILLPESISQVTGNPFYTGLDGMIKEDIVHISANHPYLTINDGVMYGKRDKRVICYFPNRRTEYSVPNGILTIGKHAIFSDRLTRVILPDSVTRIEESGIYGALINYLRLPNRLRYIGKWAFSPRTEDKTYVIPQTVETIEPHAFSGVNLKLESEDCPFGIHNDVLFEKSTKTALCIAKADLRDLIIPNTVQIVANEAFFYSNLKSVKLPNTVTEIGDKAFAGSLQLEEVKLPTSLRKIGKEAFEGCKKLRLKVPSSVIEIGAYAFGNYDNINLLIVEAGSYAEEYAKRCRYQYSTNSNDIDPMAWLNEDQMDEETDDEDQPNMKQEDADADYQYAIQLMDADRYEDAFVIFSALSEAGNANAQYQLGHCFELGKGISKDLAKAAYWYELAAKQGHAQAQFEIAYAYLFGYGIEKDYSRAYYWNNNAAEQNNTAAMVQLGLQYENGWGVQQNVIKSHEWYEKAALLGDMSGMCNNAIDYLCGRGVPKDARKAAYWNQKAAELGEPKAQFNLAEQYRTGDGVDQDISQAIYWYKESAQKGHKMAQMMCVTLGVNEV